MGFLMQCACPWELLMPYIRYLPTIFLFYYTVPTILKILMYMRHG
jgi:hypothetical protein